MGLLRKAALTVARGLGLTDQRLISYFGGEESHSGERVTVDSSLTLDAVWACTRLMSQTIATLPLPLYERDAQGRNNVASGHPLYRVLHDKPNAEMTAVEFWQALFACKLLWGNAYAEIVRGANERVVALLPMRPDRVQVTREVDGSLTYRYAFQGLTQTFTEDQVLHLKGFSLDGQIGMSAIAAGRHSLGSAMGAERSAGRIFKNGMRPSGFLKAPMFLTPEQREDAKALIAGWKGADNTGSTPLLEGGFDFQSLTIPPEDAQLLETRGFNVEVICRWFGVLPVMIGHMDKATAWGTGLEQMNLWFLTYTLRSHLKATEQAIWSKCLTAAEQLRYFPEFNVEGLLRADSKGRAELYSAEVTHGLSTPNEIRSRENKPPLPGGDSLFMQSAMLPIEKLGQAAPATPESAPQIERNRASGGALDEAPFGFMALAALARMAEGLALKAFDGGQLRDARGRWVSGLAAAFDAVGLGGKPVRAQLGTVRRAGEIRRLTGIDVSGFAHTVTNQGIAHVRKKRPGLLSNATDVGLLREVALKPDRIFAGKRPGPNGQPRIVFEKTIGKRRLAFVAEIHAGKRRIELVTLWD
ncbi:phage portal protein [Methylobacterium sp. Leaf106]|uniref:phage portal protein n=1 Tax=Methylobacterium sp. Leaf106 TaxID=1736255 RepID=UPI000B05FD55|nr:phage portal protein [Methylobacterium sp. Leaf106]